jgi:murein tripeptide amidase MpaA
MIQISSSFDGGAIEVERAERADDIALRIRRDSHQDFTQWFYFRVSGVRAEPLVVRFLNAGQCTYPGGWPGYQVVASYDRLDWFRIATRYANGVLEVEFTPACDAVYFAYFEPYPWDRHLDFLGRVQGAPGATVRTLAVTLEGRPVDVIELAPGQGGGAPVWVIARQHPGETMAQWFVEGLVERLVDASDPLALTARSLAHFHIVPNMNPDGAARGNLRTNAAGANLNREWSEPSLARSPEVLAVRERMMQSGVVLFLDAHGDEALPYVFVAGGEMIPGFTDRQRIEQDAFIAEFIAASPDFQKEHGYPAGKYSSDALKLASKWVGHRFSCLSLTLEMPFKDNANRPETTRGWSGQRSKQLGAAIVQPIVHNLMSRGA